MVMSKKHQLCSSPVSCDLLGKDKGQRSKLGKSSKILRASILSRKNLAARSPKPATFRRDAGHAEGGGSLAEGACVSARFPYSAHRHGSGHSPQPTTAWSANSRSSSFPSPTRSRLPPVPSFCKPEALLPRLTGKLA
jgi:hypothetical protein